MTTSTPPHPGKKTPKPLAKETDSKFNHIKAKYGISDQPKIMEKLKILKVGESITYENVSGSLLANLMADLKNFTFELIDCFGTPAPMHLDGRNIYVASARSFRHEHTYHVHRVRATSGTHHEKWTRVFNSYDWLDNKSVFGTVRITKRPIWYRSKAPKVD